MKVKQKVPPDEVQSSGLLRLLCTLAAFLIILPMAAWGETPYEKVWLQQLGSGHREWAVAIAADSSGNLFVTGETNGALEEGNTNWGTSDVFLAKFSAGSGEKLWVKQIGVAGNDGPQGMVVDCNGDVLVAGYTEGTLDPATPRTGNLFLAKFSGVTGDLVWLKQFGNALLDHTWDMVLDDSGNIFLAGWTEQGSLGGEGLGERDIFLAKVTASTGEFVWVKRFGTAEYDTAVGVAVDTRGNVFVTGITSGALEEGKPTTYDMNVFLIKASAATGEPVWIKQRGDSPFGHAASVVADGNGDLFLTGDTPLFVAKFSGGTGELLWVTTVPPAGGGYPTRAALDTKGNVFVTGYTYGSLDGNDSAGEGDVFLAKLSVATGTKLWVKQFGTAGHDVGSGVIVDANGNVFVTGVTEGALQEGEPSAGSTDFFLAKFKAPSLPEPPSPPPPWQQMKRIIIHFDQGVAAGAITGNGKGHSAEQKKRALRSMLVIAYRLIAQDRTRQACLQLRDVYLKMDGLRNPPDFVRGPAVAALADEIVSLKESLGCRWSPRTATVYQDEEDLKP